MIQIQKKEKKKYFKHNSVVFLAKIQVMEKRNSSERIFAFVQMRCYQIKASLTSPG